MHLRVPGLVLQVHFDPEGRVRVTGVKCVLGMGLEQFVTRGDIGQGCLATGVFKHLHHAAQGQALCGFVKSDCAGQHR